jgi:hypothetical protein
MTTQDLYERLASQVRTMRQMQKQYFKTRDYSILSQARAAEKDVDNTLADIEKAARPETEQKNLF